MREIVRLELEPFSGRIAVEGPDVMLSSRATQTFALIVHELATNAVKHGSLSEPRGRVAVGWSVDHAGSEPRFRFSWLERDGPLIAPPARQGFGRVVIEKAAAEEFGAEPKISFAAEGLSYEIDAPLALVGAHQAAAAIGPHRPTLGQYQLNGAG